MAYGERYIGSFDNVKGVTYTVTILQKDYTGESDIIRFTGKPVVHSWATDDPHATIKGSSMVVSLLNTGSLPITTFYSNDDTEYKCWLYQDTDKLFEGFLVQDDCSEVMVDFVHEIVLSFTDNLGLLKDIPLDQNVANFGNYPATVVLDYVSPLLTNNCFIYLNNTNFVPVVSEPFTVSGHYDSFANATWTPLTVTEWGLGWKVKVADNSFADSSAWASHITGSSTIDLDKRNTLLDVIRVCLFQTGMELNIWIFANIWETSQHTDKVFLEQTYIDCQSFISGESYMDCYAVLDMILGRFNLTLFQSNGVWNIIRWQEMRYYNPTFAVPNYIYTANGEFVSTELLSNNFVTGFEEDTYPEYGLMRSIFRPYNFDQETFKYEQPKYLLRNFDLNDLGDLITTYTSGANTIKEYEFTDWVSGNGSGSTFYIRVVTTTATGDEVERYVVVTGGSTGQSDAVRSYPFEVSEGDKVTFEFTYWTTDSQAGSMTNILALKLTDGTTTKYADEDPTVNWKTGVGWNYTIAAGDNSNIEHQVKMDPGQVPFDGLIYCYLPQADLSSTVNETRIKDIRITYEPYVNKSTKITGHIHKSIQDENIKNNESLDITLDDSPRNSIVGTLYRTSYTDLLQDRTSIWARDTFTEVLKVGNIITNEKVTWRQVPRTKLEGRFIGIKQDHHVSLLTILTNNALPGVNFTFGSLEIDYIADAFSGTQWEIYTDGEELLTRTDIDYTFKYIYS